MTELLYLEPQEFSLKIKRPSYTLCVVFLPLFYVHVMQSSVSFILSLGGSDSDGGG